MFDDTDRDETLQAGLAAMDRPRRVAFAASCTERLMPCYLAFSLEARWGRYQVLRNILDAIWDSLLGTLPNQRYVARASRQCERETPDPGEQESLLVNESQYAGDALLSTLNACIDDDPEHAFSAAQAAVDAVDSYLLSVTGPSAGYLANGSDLINDSQSPRIVELARSRFAEIETMADQMYQWVLDAPLMNAELQKQQSDLRLLQSAEALNDTVLGYLRGSSALEGIQPFARLLVRRRARR